MPFSSVACFLLTTHNLQAHKAREEWVHWAAVWWSVIRCNFSRKLPSSLFQRWEVVHESNRNGSFLPLENLGQLVKTSICSTQIKGPLNDFNQNTDGQQKSPESSALFTWVSELKERSQWQQDCGVYRGETDKSRAGGTSIVSSGMYWNGVKAVKHTAVTSRELPVCLQTQVVVLLTLTSLISLYIPLVLLWKTATWF